MHEQDAGMTDYDSPVKRLYDILKQAAAKTGTAAARYIWADVLGVDRDDSRAVYLAIADLINLADMARKQVEHSNDPNKDTYLEVFPRIREVVAHPNLQTPWNQLGSKYLDEQTMLKLKMAARAVSATFGRAAVDTEELNELRGEVEALLDKTLNANLPQILKARLVEHLEIIHRAIVNYPISGTEGLRRAFEGAVGMTLIHGKEITNTVAEDSREGRTLHGWLQVLANFAELGSFGVQLAPLLGPVFPKLLGPGG